MPRALAVLLVALLALSAGGAQAFCQYWYDFEPGEPCRLDVNWPTEPPVGFDWRYGIPLTATADDDDTADIFEWNELTQEYEFWTQMEVPGSPEIKWTCSWGIFSETGNSEAVGPSVQWMPTEPLQDSVTIDCEANDRHGVLGLCDGGNRDDDDDDDSAVYNIRYPDAINVASRRRDAADPPLDEGNQFGYYNMVQILDNWGEGFAGLEVRQELASLMVPPFFPTNTHTDPTSDAGITWMERDTAGVTDEHGWIRRFDLVQTMNTEMDLRNDSLHFLKRAEAAERTVLRRMYCNPISSCTAQHVNSYPSLPPE